MDDISVKINDNANKMDVDKIFTFDDKQHNGKPITMIEISPNEKYLITYSEEDRSIVGWNVEDMDKVQLKFDQTVKIDGGIYNSLCVSDDKKLVYNDAINIVDMNNKDKKIALSFDRQVLLEYCTFNLKGEFILYSSISSIHSYFGRHKIIWIYSTQAKNNKWECKRFYRIPGDYYAISISKYDKVYLFSKFSNDYIYEWNINTEKSVKIFVNNEYKNEIKTSHIGIFIKINDDANKIEIDVDKIDVADQIDIDKIDVDKNDVDKIFTFDDEQHNGKPINRIEISPNDKYLITYSYDDYSIVGWNVEDMDKVQLKFDQTVKIDREFYGSLCVSDDKKLAYTDDFVNIVEMNNKDKKIALSFDKKNYLDLFHTN
ncbi:hypothetical protein RhiirA4_477964 [Rhizophagus irregularis]|uniref:WD40 repeat-like protein n=1 Tax=Rhizophagus irregularis TaxID=588596 RepID=A0A2I1HE15_9GLOM|nr:hypothetical protein RhiirA4_477964 [Rhizophagus irregularis]